MAMLYVKWTDPPSHIIGERRQVFPPIIDEGREPVEEFEYAKLTTEEKSKTPLVIRRPDRVRLTDDQVRQMRPPGVEDLALVNARSPGDVVAMTAVVRELHKAHPGKFRTVVQTWFPQLWQGNPHVTPEAEIVQPRLIEWDWSDTVPDAGDHFVHCWRNDLARKLGVPIPLSDIRGDVYLSDDEKQWPADLLGEGPRPFAIVNAGVKPSGGAKAWGRDNYQAVVDHYRCSIEFVQIGEGGKHRHPPLSGAINLIGKTGIRDLVRLVYWSDLVLCPVTFVMHLSAAIPHRSGGIRPCVVLAGGREPASVAHYDGHTTIGTVGALSCCATGPCWRWLLPPDQGHPMAQCIQPVETASGEYIGRCFDIIPVRRVTDAIDTYLAGDRFTN